MQLWGKSVSLQPQSWCVTGIHPELVTFLLLIYMFCLRPWPYSNRFSSLGRIPHALKTTVLLLSVVSCQYDLYILYVYTYILTFWCIYMIAWCYDVMKSLYKLLDCVTLRPQVVNIILSGINIAPLLQNPLLSFIISSVVENSSYLTPMHCNVAREDKHSRTKTNKTNTNVCTSTITLPVCND